MARIAVMPEEWFIHPDTGADEIAVLATLSLHASKEGTCYPTQGHLASMLGRSRPWINKVITRLVELGLVVRIHRQRNDGGDRSCLYHLATNTASAVHTDGSAENTGSHRHDSVKTEQEINKGTHTANAHVNFPSSAKVIHLKPTETLEIPSDNWQPTDIDLLWMLDRFPHAADDLQTMTERFVTRCRAKGYRYRDISAAWRTWVSDDLRKPSVNSYVKGGRRSAAQMKFNAWAGVAARAGGDCNAA